MTVHPAFPARRGGSRATTWWGRAWIRAVEESAYDESDLREGWRLARAGVVGGISVSPGILVAAVAVGDEARTVEVALPVLGEADLTALVEVVAAESGRIAALLAGELPASLAEHAEEVGVPLVPEGFEASCTCDAWVQPCPHALAVLDQAAWLQDVDPLVLLELLGLPRARLLDELAGLAAPADEPVEGEADLDVAEEAVARALRLLGELEA